MTTTNNAGRQALLGILGLAPPGERTPPSVEQASFSTPPLSSVSAPLQIPPVMSPLPASADNQQGAEKGRAILNMLRSGGKAAASTQATPPSQGAEPQGNKTALLCSVLGIPGMGTGALAQEQAAGAEPDLGGPRDGNGGGGKKKRGKKKAEAQQPRQQQPQQQQQGGKQGGGGKQQRPQNRDRAQGPTIQQRPDQARAPQQVAPPPPPQPMSYALSSFQRSPDPKTIPPPPKVFRGPTSLLSHLEDDEDEISVEGSPPPSAVAKPPTPQQMSMDLRRILKLGGSETETTAAAPPPTA